MLKLLGIGFMMAALCSSVLAETTTERASETWDIKFYNPKPSAGDFVLPMPCGAAMVFRRIETPVGPTSLDDRMMIFGDPDPETKYTEFTRQGFLAGGFGDGGNRFFYLGKYEVTADQARTARGEACFVPSNEGRLPLTGVNWFDAIELSNRYNQWLYKNARNTLPTSGGALAFVRLPTEAEWEYSARGGVAVSESEFRDRLFPMTDDITQYAWFQGSQSAAGRPRPIGSLNPNPLGLHDVIGNVSEIVLEPFRLNKVGRLHGQAGAFTIKGGDFQTAEPRLRSFMRLEVPHFEPRTGEPTHLPTIGVRFAIAVTAISSLARARELRADFDTLSTRAEALPDDPQLLIEAMIHDTADQVLKHRLQVIAAKLAEQLRDRTEFEARAVQSSLRSAVILVRDLRDMDARIRAIEKFLSGAKQDHQQGLKDAGKRVSEYSEAIDQVRTRSQISLNTYSHLVVEVSEDYRPELTRTQFYVLNEEFRAQGLVSLPRFASVFVDHVELYRTSKSMATQQWLQDILR